MTARQIYEAMLIEMNKVEAPSMLLEDFNYFFNKAIYQYINKKYNMYDANQQSTDDVRVLKSTAVLYPQETTNPYGDTSPSSLYGGVVEFLLPQDYLHSLNCICNFKVKKTFKCYNKGDEVQFSARRLTSDMWSLIINNFYMRPMYKRPYYFIHNVNTSTDLPTNPSNEWASGTDSSSISTLKPGMVVRSEKVFDEASWINQQEEYVLRNNTATGQISNTFPCVLNGGSSVYVNVDPETGLITKVSQEEPVSKGYTKFGDTVNIPNDLPRTITIGTQKVSLVEKPGMNRYGNASPVRMEIRYGKDKTVFELDKIYVDYIKTPQHIRLTQEQLDLTEDTSQIIEFPDYVCQEIINELVKLMMENASDPRLQTNIPINQTIASPAPQQQQ